MSGFTKLDAGILHSTIWLQPHDVLRVWICLLALADMNGVAHTAAPGLAHMCMIPLDRIRKILLFLESPDADSRSEAEEGRRIVKLVGGWHLVNHAAYRAKRNPDADRERKREWDRLHRSSGNSRAAKSAPSPTQSDKKPTSPTSPTQAEAEAEATRNKELVPSRGSRLHADWVLPNDWQAWAIAERPDLDVQKISADFADYWHAKPGKDGRKSDWQATWRRWVRNQHVESPRTVGRGFEPKTLPRLQA